MFVLVTLRDSITIHPNDFERDTMAMLADEIERKFVGETLVDLGLIMGFWDFHELSPGFVYPADGHARYDVAFRLVAFRPFVGEVLVGRLSRSDETGLHVSLAFFDDVHIPSHLLPTPSEYRREENVWLWKYADEDAGDAEASGAGEQETQQFQFSIHESIRFRVRSVNFTQVHATPSGRQAMTTSTSITMAASGVKAEVEGEPPIMPAVRKRSSSTDLNSEERDPPIMLITGNVSEEGFGLPSWWS